LFGLFAAVYHQSMTSLFLRVFIGQSEAFIAAVAAVAFVF
jgi:hypothetical protein